MLPRSTSKNQEDVSPYSRNLQERQNFTASTITPKFSIPSFKPNSEHVCR